MGNANFIKIKKYDWVSLNLGMLKKHTNQNVEFQYDAVNKTRKHLCLGI